MSKLYYAVGRKLETNPETPYRTDVAMDSCWGNYYALINTSDCHAGLWTENLTGVTVLRVQKILPNHEQCREKGEYIQWKVLK